MILMKTGMLMNTSAAVLTAALCLGASAVLAQTSGQASGAATVGATGGNASAGASAGQAGGSATGSGRSTTSKGMVKDRSGNPGMQDGAETSDTHASKH